jgi:hypothetical protein
MAGAFSVGGGTGHFMFTQFATGGVLATGGYEFHCPQYDTEVTGCFRYAP